MPQYSILEGRIEQARWCESPNFESRPATESIDLIVVHCISLPPGKYGACGGSGDNYIDLLFSNRLPVADDPYFDGIANLKVSAHAMITRQGELVQYVDLDKRAWHAGESCFKGRTNCNDFSIGIELEGTDVDTYTEQQYTVLSALIVALKKAYPNISDDRIVGHEHIAAGRKTDPGPNFDWSRLRELIQTTV